MYGSLKVKMLLVQIDTVVAVDTVSFWQQRKGIYSLAQEVIKCLIIHTFYKYDYHLDVVQLYYVIFFLMPSTKYTMYEFSKWAQKEEFILSEAIQNSILVKQ